MFKVGEKYVVKNYGKTGIPVDFEFEIESIDDSVSDPLAFGGIYAIHLSWVTDGYVEKIDE